MTLFHFGAAVYKIQISQRGLPVVYPWPHNLTQKKMATDMGKAEEITNCVFNLFRKYGENDYIGEPISQQEHMIQCAMLAEKHGYSDAIVLGALLHDIGHLIGLDRSLPSMGDGVGTENHEVVGEQFLKEQGFGPDVYSFARGHVDAKRYLVFKHSDYYDKVLIQQ